MVWFSELSVKHVGLGGMWAEVSSCLPHLAPDELVPPQPDCHLEERPGVGSLQHHRHKVVINVVSEGRSRRGCVVCDVFPHIHAV